MIEIRRTDEFDEWLARLRDAQGRQRILARITRLSFGNPGDVKPVGDGVSEMRVPHGPGYRVYFTRRGELFVVLLIGGDKSSQDKDIAKAKQLAAGLGEDD
ncbi:MAG: type II toxin-antitoxin system RelE/ParE family toxin [Clostridiales bacterium]|nr:type II toxin-antitoxin system RelE/ParE family toxin [Clostridiales bacterium]